MSYYYIQKPVGIMRQSCSTFSPVVSQARFAEQVQVIQEEGDWAWVQSPDQYRGWMLRDCITQRKTPYVPSMQTSRLSAHFYREKSVELGPLCTIPYGCGVEVISAIDPRWIEARLPGGQPCFIQRGDLELRPLPRKVTDLPIFSKKFIAIPYTWGGRTSFGFDCSGFIQMLYEQIGIDLPRDSGLQAQDPRFIRVPLEKLRQGDLIFWGTSESHIFHVGLYLGKEKFIHATSAENKPWIRISHLHGDAWKEGASHRPYRLFLQLSHNIEK